MPVDFSCTRTALARRSTEEAGAAADTPYRRGSTRLPGGDPMTHAVVLPEREAELLASATSRAVDLASSGRLVAGYDELVQGQRRVEALRDAGESWGIVLAVLWEA